MPIGILISLFSSKNVDIKTVFYIHNNLQGVHWNINLKYKNSLSLILSLFLSLLLSISPSHNLSLTLSLSLFLSTFLVIYLLTIAIYLSNCLSNLPIYLFVCLSFYHKAIVGDKTSFKISTKKLDFWILIQNKLNDFSY